MTAGFAVKVAGLDDDTDQCRWVLAVDPDGDRLLVIHEDKTLHWHPMADCAFVKMISPEAPVPVIQVQPRRRVEPVNLNGLRGA